VEEQLWQLFSVALVGVSVAAGILQWAFNLAKKADQDMDKASARILAGERTNLRLGNDIQRWRLLAKKLHKQNGTLRAKLKRVDKQKSVAKYYAIRYKALYEECVQHPVKVHSPTQEELDVLC
jgi:hypothetical protein